MVHRREVDGQAIVLGNHGALWGNAMTWFDHETGSIWSQPLGEAIAGPLKGTRLELLPSTLTEWGDWRAAHPDSFALDAPSTFSGFDLDDMAVVVEIGEDSMAFPVSLIRRVGVVNEVIRPAEGGDDLPVAVPVAVAVAEEGDNWAVFARTLDDRVVELTVEVGVLIEVGGDGRWDPVTGLGLDGTDQNLSLLPGFTSFPRDYTTFFPDGAVWQPSGTVTVEELLDS